MEKKISSNNAKLEALYLAAIVMSLCKKVFQNLQANTCMGVFFNKIAG